jgi:hypothetical protein
MCEEFTVKNVAPRTDHSSFTVWIKTAFSRMAARCIAAFARWWKNRNREPEALARGPRDAFFTAWSSVYDTRQ